MKRLGIVVGVTALLLSGCAGGDDTDTKTSAPRAGATETTGAADGASTGSTAATESGEPTTATDPADDPVDVGTATVGESESGESESGEIGDGQATAAPTLERPSEEILDEAGWLTGGKITIGPVGPQDEPEIDVAMCDYLFGSPEQIAQTVGITGTIELSAAESGFAQLGGTGGGVRCLYLVDGVDAFGAIMWNKELEGSTGVVLQEQMPGGDMGIVAVNPEVDSVTIDEDIARAWLQDADTRWGGQSV